MAAENHITSSHTRRRRAPVPSLIVPAGDIEDKVFYSGRHYTIRTVGLAQSNGFMFIYYAVRGTEMLLVLDDIPVSGGGYHAKFWDAAEFDKMMPLNSSEVRVLVASQAAQQLIRSFAVK